MSLSFTVNVNISNNNAADRRAAKRMVEEENKRRQDAATEEVPAVLLPLSTNQELLGSYKTVLEEYILPNAHASYVDQADKQDNASVKDAYLSASESQRDQVKALLGL